jgi:hypothetical protein
MDNTNERLGSRFKFRNPKPGTRPDVIGMGVTIGNKSAFENLRFYGRYIIGVDQIPDGDDQNKDNPENNGNNHPVLGSVGFDFLIFGFHGLKFMLFRFPCQEEV